MHRFSVWAPAASQAEVLIGDRRFPMAPDRSMPESRPGWWSTEVADATVGTDYLFSIDGAAGRPDPRSGSQPYGVDGPSRVVDHSTFSWTERAWRGLHLTSAVIYELHVGTFTYEGTFSAAVRRLPHLVDLGVDAIELLPVAEASGDRGWGYDGVDWFAPHHALGGPDGLKGFVDAAHSVGLGVVLDVVYNHLGPAGNYLGEFGPYFTDRYRTNWGPAMNFDGAGSDEVRRFVIDNASMWLRDYHLDGLRLDAVHAITDHSAVHILEQLAGEVRVLSGELGRPLWLIGESDLNDPVFVRSPEAGGYGLASAWADEFHHALHAVLTGDRSGYYEDFGSIGQLATALRRAWVYAGEWSPHRRRTHGRSPAGLAADRFVVFLQNHDQIGNRAQGERIGALAGPRRAKIGAALVLLSPFVPLVFQGEEWLASAPFLYFTDHADPDLAAAVTEGRRREFASFGSSPEDVPDPQATATFEESRLDWAELDKPDHRDVLDWYREVIELRRRIRALAGGDPTLTRVRFDEAANWLAAERPGLLVAANFGNDAVSVPTGSSDERGYLVLASDPGVTPSDAAVLLPPLSVAVFAAAEEGRPS